LPPVKENTKFLTVQYDSNHIDKIIPRDLDTQEVIAVLKKLYLFLKNDVEHRKALYLLAHIILFTAIWVEINIFIISIPLSEPYFLVDFPIFLPAAYILGSFLLFMLFILSAFCMAELIHRARYVIKSRKGWILIDSIIGVTILSIAIVAMLLMFTQSTKGTANATNLTKATYLAQQAMNKLKIQDGSTSIDTSVITTPINGYAITVSTPTVSVISSDTNTKPLSNYLKPYQITVSWTESSGQKKLTMFGYCYVNP
jgi:type II secretory pathway pseudopilin PulG